MSITSEDTKIYITLSTAVEVIVVNFYFIQSGDLAVVKENGDFLVEGVDYTVTGAGNTAGGTVKTIPTVGNALAIGSKLAIYRDGPLDQQTELVNNGTFSPTAIERALDKLATQIMQVREFAEQALHIPPFEGVDGYATELSNKTKRADKYLGFDSAGDAEMKEATTPSDWEPDVLIVESDLNASKGVTQAPASPGDSLIFNGTGAPYVDLTAGTWVLHGGVVIRTSDVADSVWARFYNNDEGIGFGGGASVYSELKRLNVDVHGSIVIGAGATNRIYFQGFTITNQLEMGAAGPDGPSGYIHAQRIHT